MDLHTKVKIKKRCLFLILILIFIFIVFAGCNNNENNIDAYIYNFNLLIYNNESGINAFEVDINNYDINISESPLYSLPEGSMAGDRIFPQFWYDNILILRDEPIFVNDKYNYKISDENTRYYNQYTLFKENNKWHLKCDSETIAEYEFILNGNNYEPISFYIDDLNKAYILCTYWNTVDMGIAVFTCNIDDNLKPEVINYKLIFDELKIETTLYPYYCYSGSNVSVCKDGFLYNEGAKIYIINPNNKKLTLATDEEKIKNNMPFLDTTRPSYEFFSSASFQANYYLVSFTAWNSLQGTYVCIYDLNFNFCGYMSITNNIITITDNNNNIISSKEGTFTSRLYIN